MWRSIAQIVCGAPKPRKAPLGGVLVATAIPSMRACVHAYAPARGGSPRESTTGVRRHVGAAVHRCSAMSSATRAPSFVQPVATSTRAGCRLVVASMSSLRP